MLGSLVEFRIRLFKSRRTVRFDRSLHLGYKSGDSLILVRANLISNQR